MRPILQTVARWKCKKRLPIEASAMILVFICMLAMLLTSFFLTKKSAPVPQHAASATPAAASLPPPTPAPMLLLDAQVTDSSNFMPIANRSTTLSNIPAHEVTLTAYCSCPICCGQWSQYGLTASGTTPKASHTIAHESLPFGTKVLINQQIYTVEDRGVFGDSVDIYFDTHEQALEFGRQQGVMTVLADR